MVATHTSACTNEHAYQNGYAQQFATHVHFESNVNSQFQSKRKETFRTYSSDAQKFIFGEFQQKDDVGMNNYKKSVT